jgi:hypothetical protein
MVLDSPLHSVPPELGEESDVGLERLGTDLFEVLRDIRPQGVRKRGKRGRLLVGKDEMVILQVIQSQDLERLGGRGGRKIHTMAITRAIAGSSSDSAVEGGREASSWS